MIMITEDLQNLYQTYLGEVPEEIVELPSSGSNRRYFRLTGTQKLIGVYGTAKEENEAFLYMAAHFRKKGLPVPKVYICSEDKNCYLQEDLGDILLSTLLKRAGDQRLLRRGERNAAQDHPLTAFYPICRSRRL